MVPTYSQKLQNHTYRWLITGGAGFIGSHIVEKLIQYNQKVTIVDNFSTGFKKNIEPFLSKINLIEGDLADSKICDACFKEPIDFVLHQAALGSVPFSIEFPEKTHEANVMGFFNILNASRINKVKSFIYASSSSVYGDDQTLPKIETKIGQPLSPYGLSKRIAEEYAQTFSKVYGLCTTGIRYFNVFGPRQNPNGAYAAVIPLWIKKLVNNEEIRIFGDGETSRDFCYVSNVVDINILTALASINPEKVDLIRGQVFNCAVGKKTTLNQLFKMIAHILKDKKLLIKNPNLVYEDFRYGDITHSHASIELSRQVLEFHPSVELELGLDLSISSLNNY